MACIIKCKNISVNFAENILIAFLENNRSKTIELLRKYIAPEADLRALFIIYEIT